MISTTENGIHRFSNIRFDDFIALFIVQLAEHNMIVKFCVGRLKERVDIDATEPNIILLLFLLQH